MSKASSETAKKQLLHLVLGGELTELGSSEFRDLDKIEIVGVYPNYAAAYVAWKAEGAADSRQCHDALLHRSFAPAARPRNRSDCAQELRRDFRTDSMWRTLRSSSLFRRALGNTMAGYLRIVNKTVDMRIEPENIYEIAEREMPIILTFWHGQHFLAPFIMRSNHRAKVLISRHADADINAIAAEALGVETIRGSGSTNPKDFHRKNARRRDERNDRDAGAGIDVALTADVPKISARCGPRGRNARALFGKADLSDRDRDQPADRRRQLGSSEHRPALRPWAAVAAEPIRVRHERRQRAKSKPRENSCSSV